VILLKNDEIIGGYFILPHPVDEAVIEL